jgi:hypothetical protein
VSVCVSTGRGIPQNYSSEPKSGVSQQWGEARGKYFTLNVPSGTSPPSPSSMMWR